MAARRRRREGFAEKRERLGAIDDPALVLEAALRFLEPRQRSIGEVRRRLTRVGYREDLVEGAIARPGAAAG
jgi:SOS response regulatory protein OraA/RecX